MCIVHLVYTVYSIVYTVWRGHNLHYHDNVYTSLYMIPQKKAQILQEVQKISQEV